VDEATTIAPLPSNDAARGDAVREMESFMSSLPSLHALTESDPELLACPSCGHREKELEMFLHFKKDHRDENQILRYVLEIGKLRTQLLVFVKLSKFPFRPFKMDNRYVSYHNRWPWDGYLTEFEFSVCFVAKDYVLDGEKAVIEDLRKSIDVLYLLLRKIRPTFDWGSGTEVEQIFITIDTLWKLCMSSNALSTGFDLPTPSGLLQVRRVVGWLLTLANAIDSTANRFGLPGRSSTPKQALKFANSVRGNYLNELNQLVQCMASLDFLLQTCSVKA
jgi:hypothetical protein